MKIKLESKQGVEVLADTLDASLDAFHVRHYVRFRPFAVPRVSHGTSLLHPSRPNISPRLNFPPLTGARRLRGPQGGEPATAPELHGAEGTDTDVLGAQHHGTRRHSVRIHDF